MKVLNIKIAAFCCLFSSIMGAQTDTVPPTLECINGISVEVQYPPMGFGPVGVTVWASDFLQFVEDDFTPIGQVQLALRDPQINPGAGFPLTSDGQPQESLFWECSSQFGVNAVEVWARDAAGNAAFCMTYLFLYDTYGDCGIYTSATMVNQICIYSPSCPAGMANVLVKVTEGSPNPGIPPIGSGAVTNGNGCLGLTTLPVIGNYEATPEKDLNPLNGVSTFDLVRISKHVLNVQPFTSPLQFVAADINHNNNVTTFDIVELRKLILGIYTDFPANTSWRFVLRNQGLGAPFWYSNLLESCPLTALQGNCDFDAVKIGDLTGDVICNNFAPPADDRASTLLSLENRPLTAGQTIDLPIFLEKENSLLAWQFGLKFDPDFIEIQETLPDFSDGSGAIPMVARTAPGRVAMNWFSASPRTFLEGRDALISLKINVLRDCKLSDVLFLEKENLAPEVFFSDETGQPISLIFSEKKETAPAQNLTAWPNPFSEKTTLEWSQSQSGEASIDVFDATGRAVFSQKVLGEKGANRFEIDGISEGLFFVKIQSGGDVFTATILEK